MKAIAYIATVLAAGTLACSSDDDGDDSPPPASTTTRAVTRTDIVADQPGVGVTDPLLVNAWGLAFNPSGVAWVSAEGTGVSTVYDANGTTVRAPVTIPGPNGDPSSPTGQVFNGDEEAFDGNIFIFVTEQGIVAGWRPDLGDEAELHVDNSEDDASSTGVTIVRDADDRPLLFAADHENGRIDVFDSEFEPLETQGGFEDLDIPGGYAPYNVEELDGAVVVTYSLQDDEDEDQTASTGFVNLFSVDGNLIARLVSNDELAEPWGVAVAPPTFTAAPNRLLIGNFGDGAINVYALDRTTTGVPTAAFEGALHDSGGDPILIEGLWALKFGVDAGGFSSSDLYFTAGPDGEEHGVFGRIESFVLPPPPSGTTGGGIY